MNAYKCFERGMSQSFPYLDKDRHEQGNTQYQSEKTKGLMLGRKVMTSFTPK